ncbi:threonine synthase [Sulfuracidifex metallicus]|uniref:Threonine synthase n=1 Tax=Sulfuracidifex metallicus DSM 6482 = JCM 9184 TaxID=523847 RepID=A0A6A9QFF5_SULME|nr:threonine synthase [Sulfuracidifex metallicus]MUN27957.1 threonine synthase [Sulfuracidifex metallicus DSM 6482 = JCM 9184]WOE51493.1 threonine synthase [Sulfuracidifex metallicus DSM 6482 = JCM 9184]
MKCLECGYEKEIDQNAILCPKCGGLMEILVEPPKDFSFDSLKGRGVWRYQRMIAGEYKKIVSINEGGTPLIRSCNINKNMYMKYEGVNPTGSFKDRGMTVAVSSAVSNNYKTVIAASTGNTAAAAAAYASRAGIKSFIVLPKGKVALGKLAQSILYGTTIMEVEGSFDVAMGAVMKLYKDLKVVYPLNSFNPWRLEGQKTIAFEITEEIGVPDAVIVPVGNAGNIYAIWKGFTELVKAGVTEKIPRMIGVQAEGASPIAKAFIEGSQSPLFTDNPETVATAIRIGKPVNWRKAMKAVRESRGTMLVVSDNEILKAQRDLARKEGVGAEPASSASLAGYYKALDRKIVYPDEKVVLILTGHSLKDPESMGKAETKRILINPSFIEKIILEEVNENDGS